jgi:imidazolonepropionase-like amidohydrolase
MRALFILLFSITLPAGAFAQDVVIENVTVISSSTTPPLANAHVLLRDGRVAAIDTKPLSAPANAVRLDGRGKFLTPGIMDSHVHITSTPGLPSESRNNTQAAQRCVMRITSSSHAVICISE